MELDTPFVWWVELLVIDVHPQVTTSALTSVEAPVSMKTMGENWEKGDLIIFSCEHIVEVHA